MQIVHIATPSDNKYIKQTQNLEKVSIGPDYNIMFCLYKNNNLRHLLANNKIYKQSQMSIIGNNMENYNWDFIRTYMI